MKHKYYAIAALCAWLAVVAWLGSMVVAKPAVMRVRGQDGDSPEILALRQDMARNARDMQLLTRFDGLPDTGDDGRPLLALTPPALPVSGAGPASQAPQYVLSLVVSHDRRRRAVINGQYLPPGGRLGDGARVLAIGPDWVRLEVPADGVRMLHVTNPLQDGAPGPALQGHGGTP